MQLHPGTSDEPCKFTPVSQAASANQTVYVLPARRSRPELFDSTFRFDAIPIRAKTGIDTALVSRTGTATKPAAATYKQTNRQTAKQQDEAAGQLSRAGKHVNSPGQTTSEAPFPASE